LVLDGGVRYQQGRLGVLHIILRPKGRVEKVVLECKSLLLRIFEIHNVVVLSTLSSPSKTAPASWCTPFQTFSTVPKGRGNKSWQLPHPELMLQSTMLNKLSNYIHPELMLQSTMLNKLSNYIHSEFLLQPTDIHSSRKDTEPPTPHPKNCGTFPLEFQYKKLSQIDSGILHHAEWLS
jgi:hypothetical protein